MLTRRHHDRLLLRGCDRTMGRKLHYGLRPGQTHMGMLGVTRVYRMSGSLGRRRRLLPRIDSRRQRISKRLHSAWSADRCGLWTRMRMPDRQLLHWRTPMRRVHRTVWKAHSVFSGLFPWVTQRRGRWYRHSRLRLRARWGGRKAGNCARTLSIVDSQLRLFKLARSTEASSSGLLECFLESVIPLHRRGIVENTGTGFGGTSVLCRQSLSCTLPCVHLFVGSLALHRRLCTRRWGNGPRDALLTAHARTWRRAVCTRLTHEVVWATFHSRRSERTRLLCHLGRLQTGGSRLGSKALRRDAIRCGRSAHAGWWWQ